MKKRKPLPITVLLADDHEMIRQGVADLLRENSIEVVAEAATTENAIVAYLAIESKPTVTVLDLNMPGTKSGGFTLVDTLLTYDPHARILIYSMRENMTLIRDLYNKGVYGYLTKSSPCSWLVDAVKVIAKGERYFMESVAAAIDDGSISSSPANVLTAHELVAFLLFAREYSHEDIAEKLCISPRTLSNRLVEIRKKLNDAPLSSFGWLARKYGLIELDEF